MATFYKLLRTGAITNHNVDHSSAPVYARLKNTNSHNVSVGELVFHYSDSGTPKWTNDEFGNLLVPLPNGIEVHVLDEVDNVVQDITDGLSIKTNASWTTLTTDWQPLDLGNGTFAIAVALSFFRAGEALVLRPDYSLGVLLQDNLSGLVDFFMRAEGTAPDGFAFHPSAIGLSRFWLPGELVTNLGATNFEWGEQTLSADDFAQTTVNRQPDQATDNGQAVWDYFPSTDPVGTGGPMMEITTPSAGLGGTGILYAAAWVRWDNLDFTFRFIFDRGTTSAANKGWFFRRRNEPNLFQLTWSTDGVNFDNDTLLIPTIDMSVYRFVEIVVDPLQANDDLRTQVWFDRVQQSLIHTLTNAAAMHDSNEPFRVGGDFGGTNLEGRLGPVYVQRDGVPSDINRDNLFAFLAPKAL
jgi:hypothetical protein